VLAAVTAFAVEAHTGDETGLEFVTADDLRSMQSLPLRILIVDVRTPAEFRDSHIKGAVNVTLTELERRVDEIPRQGLVVLY
jgi:rhodanese-related sulfurtransferase